MYRFTIPMIWSIDSLRRKEGQASSKVHKYHAVINILNIDGKSTAGTDQYDIRDVSSSRPSISSSNFQKPFVKAVSPIRTSSDITTYWLDSSNLLLLYRWRRFSIVSDKKIIMLHILCWIMKDTIKMMRYCTIYVMADLGVAAFACSSGFSVRKIIPLILLTRLYFQNLCVFTMTMGNYGWGASSAENGEQ